MSDILVVCSLCVLLSMCVFSLRKLLCCFCWLIRVLSSKEYVCCVCDPSVCLGVPSIGQIVCLYEGCDFRV